MARFAFVKVFAGLNFGVSQLSGELQRAGHETLTIFFKEYKLVPEKDWSEYHQSKLAGVYVAGRAKLYDFNCYKPFTDREYELLVETLREFKPDVIGFSLCSLPFDEVAEVTKRVRQHFDVPIIWGGAGPTIEPERALQYADMVCVGEGEELVVKIADAIDEGRDYSETPNLWFKRKDGSIHKNPDAPLVDMDSIAFPDYEESRLVVISDDRVRRDVFPPNYAQQYQIMTTRGCPYSCSFCIESWTQDKYGKQGSLRRRSVDLVIEELVEAKRKYDIKAVLFFDAVFTTHPAWLKEFAQKYKEKVGIPFWCWTYPRSTRKRDLEYLKDAGLKAVTMGIQSGSPTILTAYDRPIPTALATEAAKIVVDVGVQGYFELITRSEYDTEETMWETFEFLLEFPKEMQTFGFYPMIKFPTYGYTEKVRGEQRALTLSDAQYNYFHKVFLLARTSLSPKVKRFLAKSRLVRRVPSLLDPLLPAQLPVFQLADGCLGEMQRREGYEPKVRTPSASTRSRPAQARGGAARAQVGVEA